MYLEYGGSEVCHIKPTIECNGPENETYNMLSMVQGSGVYNVQSTGLRTVYHRVHGSWVCTSQSAGFQECIMHTTKCDQNWHSPPSSITPQPFIPTVQISPTALNFHSQATLSIQTPSQPTSIDLPFPQYRSYPSTYQMQHQFSPQLFHVRASPLLWTVTVRGHAFFYLFIQRDCQVLCSVFRCILMQVHCTSDYWGIQVYAAYSRLTFQRNE